MNRKEEWANTGPVVATNNGVWSVGYAPMPFVVATPTKPKAAPLDDVGNDSGDSQKNGVKTP